MGVIPRFWLSCEFLSVEPVAGVCVRAYTYIYQCPPIHKMYSFVYIYMISTHIAYIVHEKGTGGVGVSPSMSPPVSRKIPCWVVSRNEGAFSLRTPPIPLAFRIFYFPKS